MNILLSKAAKFSVSGLLATATHVITVMALVEILALNAVTATAPAFLLALIVSYLVNYRWTFQAIGTHQYHFPRFALVAMGGLCINWLIMYVSVDLLDWNYLIGLAIVVIVLPTLSFVLNYRWTFTSVPKALKMTK